jgi:hypothetical protein
MPSPRETARGSTPRPLAARQPQRASPRNFLCGRRLSEQGNAAPDVLIVAANNDRVAIRLGEDLRARGRRVSHLDGMSAARLFTIRVGSDSTSVTPAIPMFVRASCWWSENGHEQTADERFLRSEAQSAFRAVMSLLSAPVINRISATTRMTWGPIASTFPFDGAELMPEIHVSGPEMFDSPDDSLWGESYDYVVAPVSKFSTGTPLRGRRVEPDALYEIITVVGRSAFAATTDARSAELDLAAQSVVMVRDLGMNFATVTWAVSGIRAVPVRINSAPEMAELRYAWNEISEALHANLLQ